MKKLNVFLVLVFTLSVALSGCNSEQAIPTTQPASQEQLDVVDAPVAEFISHIMIFETCAATMTPDADGYSIASFVDEYFGSTPNGEVEVCSTDGYCANSTADEMMNFYIVAEGENSPTLAGKDISKGLMVKDILYISFGKEVILFVESDFPFGEVISNLGLDSNMVYNFVATDAYEYAAEDAADAENAEMRSPATTGNLVNVYFDSMGAAMRECYEIYVTE